MFKYALILAGLVQIAITLTSLAIPRLLRWREQTERLEPLTRHVFWTYAGYIFAINLGFGLLNLAAPAALLDGSMLAAAVTAFVALYWTVRVVLQFTVYDRSVTAEARLFRVAEALYVTGFVFIAVTNAAAALHNAGVLG